MEKTTKREMFTVIATLLAERKDVVDFCTKEIELLDKKSERAKAAAAKKKAEGDALMDAVFAVLSTEEFLPISTIVDEIGLEDVTTSKVVARLTALIKAERVEKAPISVTSGDKSKKVMGYRAIA